MRRRSHGEISLEVHFNISWSARNLNGLKRFFPHHTWIFYGLKKDIDGRYSLEDFQGVACQHPMK